MADTVSSTPATSAPAQGTAQPATQAQPNQATQTPAAQKVEARKHKLKIDGQDVELDESELYRRASLSSGADKRFKEGNEARKQAEQFTRGLKEDFMQTLLDPALGLTKDQVKDRFERWYVEQMQAEKLTPEQRKAKENEAELQKYRDGEKNKQKAEHDARLKSLEDHHVKNYQTQMIEAFKAEGVPKTEFTARRMIDLMSKNLQLGLDLTAAQLATLVREDYQNEIKTVLGASDGDTLLKLLGEDVANKMRKADLARLRGGIPNVPQGTVTMPVGQTETKRGQFISEDEHKAEIKENLRRLGMK